MLKKSLLSFALGLVVTRGQSQSIVPEVLASSGDQYANAGGQVSFTLGELQIETVSSGNNLLTEGFHQPDILMTSILQPDPSIVIGFSPNPANSYFNVKVEGAEGPFRLAIYDPQGKLMMEQSLSKTTPEAIDVSAFPAGMYFVRLADPSEKLLGICKLVCVH